MNWIKNIISIIENPKLTVASLRSKCLMRQYKKGNVFNAESFNKLLSENFTYRGSKPNTIFCENVHTKKPTPVKVKFSSNTFERITEEIYQFFDESGTLLGVKIFKIENHPKLGKVMHAGAMYNYSNDIKGIGFRGDQIQIERALENGITAIPREAAARATLFHAKMGFLPIEQDLRPVKSYKEALNIIKYELGWGYKCKKKIKPIITRKKGEFYLDMNKTKANTNINEIKHRQKQTGKQRVDFFGDNTKLELKGKELKHWEELIKGKEITSNLNFELPQYV